jgi:GMP synthase (glutamine-hydrolysing)
MLPGAQQGREHLAGRLVYDAALLEWLKQFLDRIFPAVANQP